MSYRFPGMDPYIESNEIWPSFHHSIAEELMTMLNGVLDPRYYADVEVRTVNTEVTIAQSHTIIPDVGILETQAPGDRARSVLASAATSTATVQAPLQRIVAVPTPSRLRAVRIFVAGTGQLVTSIEILSPANKYPGQGLRLYRAKRIQLLQSPIHLVEMDLLRRGRRPGREVADPPVDTDYVLLVNRFRGSNARISEIWPVALNEALPLLPAPLVAPDPDILLDLNQAIRQVYTRGVYARRIAYQRPVPPPKLRPAMAEWLQELRQTWPVS